MSDLAGFRGAVLWGLRMGPVGPRPAKPRLRAPMAVVFLPPPNSPQVFNEAIRLAVSYKQNSRDFMDEVLQELEVGQAQVFGGQRNGFFSEGVEHEPIAWLSQAAHMYLFWRCRCSWASAWPGLT